MDNKQQTKLLLLLFVNFIVIITLENYRKYDLNHDFFADLNH